MSKYMKRLLFLSACLLLAATACQRQQPEPAPAASIRILPVITKATATDFENGDAIGVTITRESGAYATNAQFTYDGTAFSGSLKWYNESTDPSTIKAYYPYSANGSATFTVATDQSAGTGASDFIAAIKENVLPSTEAVVLPFRHKLTSIAIQVANNSNATLGDFFLKGVIPTAVIADDFSAQADAGAEAAAIKVFKKAEGRYAAIVPPQTAILEVSTTVGGKEVSQKLKEANLLGGKEYTISVIVNPADMQIVLSGDIANWDEGGDLEPDNNTGDPEDSFVETLDETSGTGTFTYDGVEYPVVKLKDGKWWMARNLAYLPEGFTPCNDLSNVTAGVYDPITLVDGARAFATDAETLAANGYLYQAECALGLQVGGLTTEEQALALEGAQGICPTGWHLPTKNDIANLVGKGTGITTNTSAPYYDGANGSIQLLNADGFNIFACGMVSINNTSTTTGALQGVIYDNRLASSMMTGSSCTKFEFNTAGDPASGVKNVQFFGLMPMTNKASEAEYTCNGTNVSFRIAGPVRCVRNAE